MKRPQPKGSILSGPPAEIVFPVELLGRVRVIAGRHPSGSAAAHAAVLTAFAECLHSLGYGEALEEAQRLIEPPAAKPPQPFATTAAPAPEV